MLISNTKKVKLLGYTILVPTIYVGREVIESGKRMGSLSLGKGACAWVSMRQWLAWLGAVGVAVGA